LFVINFRLISWSQFHIS